MKRSEKNAAQNNIRVIAISNPKTQLLDIYIDRYGRREYVVSREYRPVLYRTLRSGIRLNDLRRKSLTAINKSCHKKTRKKNRGDVEIARINFLLRVIDEYLQYAA